MPRILNNIEARFASVQKAQKKPVTRAANDTVKAVLDMLGANFANVEPGKGMAFPIPTDTTPKKYLASIRGKLVAVVRQGEPWAGRQFRTAIDTTTNPEKPEVLVMRNADGAPLPKKVGGRPAGGGLRLVAGNGQATDENTQDGANASTKGKPGPKTQVKDLTGNPVAKAS